MSKRKSDASVVSDFAEVLQQLHNLHLSQQDQINFEGLLSDATDNMESIWKKLEDIPEKIDEEMRFFREAAAKIANEKERIIQKRADDRERNRVRAEIQASVWEAQEKEYQAKVDQLKAVEKECVYYGNVLVQKKAKVAGYHQQMQAETGELAKRCKVMKSLTEKLEANKLRNLKEQEDLESSSAELDKAMSDRQEEIQKILGQISEESKALEAVKAANRSKMSELTGVRSKTEVIRAVTNRKKQKHQKIMCEFEAVEKKRKDEIGRLEGRITEKRANYENTSKAHTEIVDRITSEFGNSKSLEKMTIQAQMDLEALDVEHTQLNESIGAIYQSMQFNENKLAELKKAEKECWQQDFQRKIIADKEAKVESPSRRSSDDESSFLQPQERVKKVKRRPSGQQQNQQQVTVDTQAVVGAVGRSASGVTGFEMSDIRSQTGVGTKRARHSRSDTEEYDRPVLFKQHFLENGDGL